MASTTETTSSLQSSEEVDPPQNIWHNYLVNLAPKVRRTNGTPSVASSPLKHIELPLSGDHAQEPDKSLAEDGITRKALNGSQECEWDHFENVNMPGQTLDISGQDYFDVHYMITTKTMFRKTWGGFVNVFDDHGRQKSCIWRSELSNYLQLHNCETIVGEPEYSFLVSLFAGNYPKPLFGSTWSWRMRWNVFVSGVEEDVLAQMEADATDTTSQCPEAVQRESGDERVYHLGEMHLYLHIERGHQWPVYQNLCFFYDPSLIDKIKHLSECNSSAVASMAAVAQQLKRQLSASEFVSQLYFPVEKTRFGAVDQSVQYFELRQRDLQAAIAIANEQVPFSFLHRALVPPSTPRSNCNSSSSNSPRFNWSATKSRMATGRFSTSESCGTLSSMSSGSSSESWRRRKSQDS